MNVNKKSKAFTIVEIIVVVIVIGILASITVVSYGRVTKNAREKSVATDAAGMRAAIMKYKAEHGGYPTSLGSITDIPSASSTFQYTHLGGYFCLTASIQSVSMYVSSTVTKPTPGGGAACPTPEIQAVSSASCPTTRTMVVDARDNRTYWIQKLADGKCWMLTNLSYAGGGANTYSDVKNLSNGTNDSTTTYTEAKYYIPAGANPTTNPAQPSTSTTGTGQYGYFYNWCAAMGVQKGTNACMDDRTMPSDPSISICPANWRLPSGGGGGEFYNLNVAVNGGSTTNPSGLLSVWLGQYGGYRYYSGVDNQLNAEYWSSTESSWYAYTLYYSSVSNAVNPSIALDKHYGISVRCVAS